MKSLSGNSLLMKEVNSNIILKKLKNEKKATTQRLSEVTGLSAVTVGSILQKLIEGKQVFKDDVIPSNGGRPAHRYCYNGEYSHVLIIYTDEDNEKDRVHASVVNLFGECIHKENFSLEHIVLESFEPIIDKLIHKYQTIKAIGFGLPGAEHNGTIITNDYKNLNGVRFSEYYRNRYNIPVKFENDVNAAVIGYCNMHEEEIKSDAAIVYVYFPEKYSPGVGIYINGKIYTGFKNFAGEVKNMPLGIEWENINYNSIKEVSNAIAKLIISIVYVLDPERIILYGRFINEDYLKNIITTCKYTLIETTLPVISKTEDFNSDFENGISKSTLDLLEKTLVLINTYPNK
ncbi:ROK family protein [Clostridium gasigenes]|uniref:ROK family protein n=1 Tax=Clostridium gasigenes TaxID=94869 RepID=UPI001C0C1B60|nr:ROK family protein [Clostridium gasigenes]MBU3132738.1 ROK family protein [Clostridium gasigenes]